MEAGQQLYLLAIFGCFCHYGSCQPRGIIQKPHLLVIQRQARLEPQRARPLLFQAAQIRQRLRPESKI